VEAGLEPVRSLVGRRGLKSSAETAGEVERRRGIGPVKALAANYMNAQHLDRDRPAAAVARAEEENESAINVAARRRSEGCGSPAFLVIE
jgi:hypothetical protein